MMKKVLHLVLAAAITLSLSACTPGNNRGNNKVGVGNNTGTDVRRLSQQNNFNNATYRDGVYTGYGNAHRNGNEMATITIQNGRIANVALGSTGQQGGTNNTTGTGTGAETNPDNGLNSGTAPGTVSDRTIGPGYSTRTGSVTDNITDTGTGTGAGPGGIGVAGNGAANGINGIRTRLASAMVQSQTYNVTIDNTDTTLVSSINNWKLAVQRALEQAR
jgi:uncharacterized protein with FMN-binding domain